MNLTSVADGSVYQTGFVQTHRIQVFKESPSPDEAGIAEFDVTSLLTEPLILQNATLRLERSDEPTGPTKTFFVNGYTGNGIIDSSDWGAGTLLVDDFSYNNELRIEFDVTSFLQMFLATNEQFLGFNIRQKEYIHNNDAEFGQAAYLDVSMAPVPIPAAVWLLGPGLIGLAGMRRFRKK